MEVYKINPNIPLFYLTFTVVHWLPVFISADPCLIICDSLNYCYIHKGLRINAFVIMPPHLHLIIFDADLDNERLKSTVRDMRQYTGNSLSIYCNQKMPDAFAQVINNPQRQDRRRQFWQQSRHAVAIWSEHFWRTKFGYVHDYPCRKGLVSDARFWRFSSARYWMLGEEADVKLSEVLW